jgi:hypothetical protein
MSELDLDLRIIYLAAGHTESGGTQNQGLSEGRENIQVVDDAVAALYDLGMGPAVPVEAGREYQLGEVLLVVVDHGLDLVPTIRAINSDYAHRCFEWG